MTFWVTLIVAFFFGAVLWLTWTAITAVALLTLMRFWVTFRGNEARKESSQVSPAMRAEQSVIEVSLAFGLTLGLALGALTKFFYL